MRMFISATGGFLLLMILVDVSHGKPAWSRGHGNSRRTGLVEHPPREQLQERGWFWEGLGFDQAFDQPTMETAVGDRHVPFGHLLNGWLQDHQSGGWGWGVAAAGDGNRGGYGHGADAAGHQGHGNRHGWHIGQRRPWWWHWLLGSRDCDRETTTPQERPSKTTPAPAVGNTDVIPELPDVEIAELRVNGRK